ncbi:MAG: M23 family metallopeptidase [Candidatus Coproplasma sp.]
MNNINEGLEYAQMLEIPVSTVNVVKKRSLFSHKAKPTDEIKEQVVNRVNEKLENKVKSTEPNGFVQAEDLTSPEAKPNKRQKIQRAERSERGEKGSKKNIAGIVLICETVTACLLAVGIFLSNIFIPNTAINAFVGSLTAVNQKEASYTDFVLTSPVSETCDAEVTVSSDGVIRFKEKTSVYPLCDGEVASISESGGSYLVKIAHTSSFCSIITGLDTVYVSVGDEVKGNLPFAYSKGEGEVRISMYDGDSLLNCYKLSGAVPVWNS